MKLTPQEKNLTSHVLDLYVDALIKMIQGQPLTPKVIRCNKELETIGCILLKMLGEEPERVVGMRDGVISNITLEEIEENTIHNMKIINK
jgi:hypothetical protein